jgi:hypothetical protein
LNALGKLLASDARPKKVQMRAEKRRERSADMAEKLVINQVHGRDARRAYALRLASLAEISLDELTVLPRTA